MATCAVWTETHASLGITVWIAASTSRDTMAQGATKDEAVHRLILAMLDEDLNKIPVPAMAIGVIPDHAETVRIPDIPVLPVMERKRLA